MMGEMTAQSIGILMAAMTIGGKLFDSFARALPIPAKPTGFYRFFHDFVQDWARNPDKFGALRGALAPPCAPLGNTAGTAAPVPNEPAPQGQKEKQ